MATKLFSLVVADASHWGDVAAVPFFGIMVWYFARIPQKTAMEWTLLLFGVAGLVCDVAFSLAFLAAAPPPRRSAPPHQKVWPDV